MNNSLMFSSNSDEWATPQAFFDELDREFHFTLDPCCTKETAKCSNFYTKDDDGLSKSWAGETAFVNPPYSESAKWIEKASQEKEAKTVMLIPARTDTRAFHRYIYKQPNVEIRFIKGRLKFGNSKNAAPFPSMVVIFN